MTSDTVPTNPSVLNTTILSNFAAIDLVTKPNGICTVPKVGETWIDDYRYYIRY